MFKEGKGWEEEWWVSVVDDCLVCKHAFLLNTIDFDLIAVLVVHTSSVLVDKAAA